MRKETVFERTKESTQRQLEALATNIVAKREQDKREIHQEQLDGVYDDQFEYMSGSDIDHYIGRAWRA